MIGELTSKFGEWLDLQEVYDTFAVFAGGRGATGVTQVASANGGISLGAPQNAPAPAPQAAPAPQDYTFTA